MSEYNLESFSTDLEAFLKANINTKINEINTDLGNQPQLKTISTNAFFFQTLDDRIANYEEFLYFEAGNPTVDDSVPTGIVETYNILILICYIQKNDVLAGKRLARYNRALKELIIDNGFRIGRKKVKVVSLEPSGFAQLNQTQVARATGLTLEVTFGK